jgi:AcrR family transcriptional regulator
MASRAKAVPEEPIAQATRRLSPEEREQQIVEKAIQHFTRNGFGGSTRELARQIGVTQPLLYRFF